MRKGRLKQQQQICLCDFMNEGRGVGQHVDVLDPTSLTQPTHEVWISGYPCNIRYPACFNVQYPTGFYIQYLANRIPSPLDF